jgi:hypothetical protein
MNNISSFHSIIANLNQNVGNVSSRLFDLDKNVKEIDRKIELIERIQKPNNNDEIKELIIGLSNLVHNKINNYEIKQNELFNDIQLLKQSNVIKPEVIKPEIIKPEVIKPEIIKPEIIKPEVTQEAISIEKQIDLELKTPTKKKVAIKKKGQTVDV